MVRFGSRSPMELIIRRKRTGPSMDLCGTPLLMASLLDNFPLARTYWYLSDRKLAIQEPVLLMIPYSLGDDKVDHGILCQTPSQNPKIESTFPPFSTMSRIFS